MQAGDLGPANPEKGRRMKQAQVQFECKKCGERCDVRHYSRSRYFGTIPLSECCQAPPVAVRQAKEEE